VIKDVQITITNVATGVTREVTTNDEGFYSAPNLLPGTYEAKLSAHGFKTEKRGGIELTVGASVGHWKRSGEIASWRLREPARLGTFKSKSISRLREKAVSISH
jgi:hypothetical protein